MATTTTCVLHPSVETGLSCVVCEDAICPRCAVEAVVGMRCPSCAAPSPGGGLRRRPDQIRRAAGVALTAGVVGGLVLGPVIVMGFLSLIAAYIIGRQIAVVVRRAAGGNTVDVVRFLAVGAAALAGLLGEIVAAVIVIVGTDGGDALDAVLAIRIAFTGGWIIWVRVLLTMYAANQEMT
jgi:hypothetical protein